MIEKLLRAIGVFYAFGGVLVLIRLGQARMLDEFYTALDSGSPVRHRVRAALLTLGGALTCVGGIALAGLSARTHWLMWTNVLVQLGWLAYAALYFPPKDDEDREGRGQSANAAIVYVLASGLVVWTDATERVTLSNSTRMDLMIALLLTVLAIWQLWLIGRRRLTTSASVTRPHGATGPATFTRPTHVELRPYPGAWPLWDSDTGANVDPDRLELPQELIARVQEFENAVLAALEQDPEQGLSFRDAARKRELEREATALARELERHLGRDSVAWRMPDELGQSLGP